MRTVAAKHGPVSLVHFDSHTGICDEMFGPTCNSTSDIPVWLKCTDSIGVLAKYSIIAIASFMSTQAKSSL